MLFYRAMLSYLPSRLSERGFVLFEIGYDQADAIKRLADEHALGVEVRADYGGNPRLAILSRR